MFSRTQKISEIAARRRGVFGGDKSVSSSRISLRTDDGVPTKAPVSDDMQTNLLLTNLKGVNRKYKVDNKRMPVKASLSMSDLSVIDRKGGDASSEESVPILRKKATVLRNRPVKKVPPGSRPPRRLRSASLDETRIHRGEERPFYSICFATERSQSMFLRIQLL